MLQTQYLKQSDFECIGVLARHCNLPKLQVAICQALDFDLKELLCYGIVKDALDHWSIPETDPDYEKYNSLINGGEYADCNGDVKDFKGLKEIWLYYAYARYKPLNEMNDTANGDVKKDNEWSFGKTYQDIVAYADQYRNMGFHAYKSLHGFLCTHKDDYPKFDDCNCQLSCGCVGTCSCGKTKKMYGTRFKIVKKHVNGPKSFKRRNLHHRHD